MPSQISQTELDIAFRAIKELEGFLPSNAARYLQKEVIGYVSPEALHSYMLGVITTYADVLDDLGRIPRNVAMEIREKVKREYVPFKKARYYEDKIRHDIRGLVRAAQDVLSDEAKSYVYPGFTSYDLINTAQSLALRDFERELMTPEVINYGENLIENARKHKKTVMVGRTHRQHATATTAGHWFTEILGGIVPPLERYRQSSNDLKGKVSGFVGNNAAKTMLFGIPYKINEKFFEKIGIGEDTPTGQTVHQHWYTNYFSQLMQICGGIWKFVDDLRSYQQTEIAEMAEQTLSEQVGSSTGSHKKNPINSEKTAGGYWRKLFGDYVSSLFDLQTDFQRDLRDSSNKRCYMYDMPNIAYAMAKTATKVSDKMTIREEKMKQNLAITKGLIAAEPLQIYMQRWIGQNHGFEGYRDMHEYVRELSNEAIEKNLDFIKLVQEDRLVKRALKDATNKQREMILNPDKYLGTSAREVELYTEKCEEIFDSLRKSA